MHRHANRLTVREHEVFDFLTAFEEQGCVSIHNAFHRSGSSRLIVFSMCLSVLSGEGKENLLSTEFEYIHDTLNLVQGILVSGLNRNCPLCHFYSLCQCHSEFELGRGIHLKHAPGPHYSDITLYLIALLYICRPCGVVVMMKADF